MRDNAIDQRHANRATQAAATQTGAGDKAGCTNAPVTTETAVSRSGTTTSPQLPACANATQSVNAATDICSEALRLAAA